MKKAILFVAILVSLSCLTALIAGCGTGASSGGGSHSPFIADIYVSTKGSDEGGDGSLSNPFRTIQKGLDSTSPTREVVGVLAGTYVENLFWPATAGVTLKGASKTKTILSGGGAGRCIAITGASTDQILTIESITIAGGYASISAGGGIYVLPDNITTHLIDVIMTLNTAEGGYGGAIYTNSVSDRIIAEGCSFLNNFAEAGGAIYMNGTNEGIFIADKSIFSGNRANTQGGGLVTVNVDMKDCVISGNVVPISGSSTGSESGGIFVRYAGSMVNCLIYNNIVNGVFGGNNNGGGLRHYHVLAQTGTLEIINCTIVSNEVRGASDGYNAGLEGTANTWVKNCIVWGNLAPVGGQYSGATVTYSDAQGISSGTGNVNVPPAFHGDPPPYNVVTDFRLTGSTPTSVTRDGTPEGAPERDYTDETLRGSQISMGAYQY